MKLSRSTLSKRYRVLVCFLVAACASTVLIACSQSLVLIANANDYTTAPQGKVTGTKPNAEDPLVALPAGEDGQKTESKPVDSKEVVRFFSDSMQEPYANLHSDPKEVTKLFVEALKLRDSSLAWGLLSSRARVEIKRDGSGWKRR